MCLTRSQMAEMGKVREPQGDQGSEEEFGSVQDESTGELTSELRRMLLAQQHELRVREMEEKEREKQRKFEMEREEKQEREREKQRQFELERERMEREERLERERMAFELRKLEMMNQNNNNNRDSEVGQLSKTDLKKFPVYNKGDCPEVFFSLVERAFVDFSVRETEKMTIMRSLISGSLAEVYAEMPVELLKDFAEFKKLVFARHGINAEQLRQKFRSLTKKPEQTFTQVGAQLVRLLEKWLSQEGTETFQQLKDLIALEQFYSVLHGELKFHVRERKPKSVAEAAEIADFIYQIRKPLGAEGKTVGKPKETYSRYSQGPGKNQQGGGAHVEGKPSDMKPPRPQILEGKPKPDEKDSKYSRKCYFCQGKGHLISECEKLKQLKGNLPHDLSGTKPKAVFCVQTEQSSLPLREPVAMATQSGPVTSADQAGENGPLVEVKRCLLVRTDLQLFETAGVDVGIFDHQYRGLRDTCSQVTLCHPDIIPRKYIIPNESLKVAGIEGQVISLPVAEVPVSFQGWRGVWRLAISSTLPAAVLVGNDLAEHVKRVLVITRSQATTETVQGGTEEPEAEADEGSPEAVAETLTTDSKFGQEQKADATLRKCFEKVADTQLTPETPARFREEKGILYRETLMNISKGGDGIRRQLVVPEKYRPMILQRGHSDMFAAHLGVNKTQQRITQNFYWPEIGKQIKEFCKQCDVCQRQGNNRDRTKAKLCPLPVIDTPVKCIGVDIVGPLPKATKRGNRFILTIVDHATRYPKAIPLTNIETNTVADALVGYMSRMGFASEIITDLGTSFTSKLMKRLWQICGIKHKETTAYHPESNGLTEKFNGTLMRMIRAYLAENPNNWDQKLQSLLFAYRSVPQASTGFSPFELLFGRKVKGPLDLIKQNWEQITQGDPQDVVTYIDTLMNDLKRNLELAAENLQAQKVRQKTWYDQKARERHFNPGEEVLWLRPCKENKLQLKWAGPYRVISKMSDLNYLIEQEDHLKHLEIVLQRLSAAGLTVKASKCQLGSPEIKYLGHIVGGGVIKPLEAKIEAVRDWPRPNTKKKVKSFLGLVGYYRKFIPRFSEMANPLTDLTRKKTDDRIPWTSDCEEAFRRLKEALIHYPVLRAPDFDREFIIYTDASNSGVGAVLCQEDENGDQHPVSYLSRKLQKGERHLATVEKECLAIVYAIQKAKPYIWGRHFVLCTDHSPLQWLKTMKTHNSKLMRWALNLQDFDFEVKVVRGSMNCVADALSRRPDE
ncbi:uncharacterized protein LOC144583976 [Pogona vitticeps]